MATIESKWMIFFFKQKGQQFYSELQFYNVYPWCYTIVFEEAHGFLNKTLTITGSSSFFFLCHCAVLVRAG